MSFRVSVYEQVACVGRCFSENSVLSGRRSVRPLITVVRVLDGFFFFFNTHRIHVPYTNPDRLIGRSLVFRRQGKVFFSNPLATLYRLT